MKIFRFLVCKKILDNEKVQEIPALLLKVHF